MNGRRHQAPFESDLGSCIGECEAMLERDVCSPSVRQGGRGALLERAVGGSRLGRRGQHSRSCSNVGRLVSPFENRASKENRIGAGAAANAVSPIEMLWNGI